MEYMPLLLNCLYFLLAVAFPHIVACTSTIKSDIENPKTFISTRYKSLIDIPRSNKQNPEKDYFYPEPEHIYETISELSWKEEPASTQRKQSNTRTLTKTNIAIIVLVVVIVVSGIIEMVRRYHCSTTPSVAELSSMNVSTAVNDTLYAINSTFSKLETNRTFICEKYTRHSEDLQSLPEIDFHKYQILSRSTIQSKAPLFAPIQKHPMFYRFDYMVTEYRTTQYLPYVPTLDIYINFGRQPLKDSQATYLPLYIQRISTHANDNESSALYTDEDFSQYISTQTNSISLYRLFHPPKDYKKVIPYDSLHKVYKLYALASAHKYPLSCDTDHFVFRPLNYTQ